MSVYNHFMGVRHARNMPACRHILHYLVCFPALTRYPQNFLQAHRMANFLEEEQGREDWLLPPGYYHQNQAFQPEQFQTSIVPCLSVESAALTSGQKRMCFVCNIFEARKGIASHDGTGRWIELLCKECSKLRTGWVTGKFVLIGPDE